MKRGNIFGINPKQPGALQMIVSEIIRVLDDRNQDQEKVQIEIKYAEFKYFSPPRYNDIVARTSDNKQRQRSMMMVHLIQQQRYFFKDSLKKLSHQNMVLLNDLGRRIYALNSCFDEERHKKFYPMRDYLIRQCQFNQNFKRKNILLPQHPKNIYHQYSMIGDNIEFEMKAKDQIRFDVIFKDFSSQLNGRYSYSNVTKGWIKTKKTQLLRQQLDLMLTEKTFRFAINNQDETQVYFQDLQGLKQQLVKRKFKQIDIRLKRTLRCTKSDIVQYSLSEVYQPQKNQGTIPNFDDLEQYITEDHTVLDQYLIGKFQHFYEYKKPEEVADATKSQIRHQIQCQFTKIGIKKMKKWVQKKQFRQIHYEVQEVIQSLYNLFFAEHSVRTHEAIWMDKIMNIKGDNEKNMFPNQRLINQFGSYMHNIMFQQMTKTKNH